MNLVKKYIICWPILLAFVICACDRPECQNTNPAFENYPPSSPEYKEELAAQLHTVDQNKLRYWLKQYKQEKDQDYLYFYVQGEGLCAVMQLRMTHWTKMEQIKEKKGAGRIGAEFTNLTFDISGDSLERQFTYVRYDRMID